jgi:hypothetical protein
MGQPSQWRDKASYYWSLSKTAANYDLCEHYAELAARCLDVAQDLEDRMMGNAMPRQASAR